MQQQTRDGLRESICAFLDAIEDESGAIGGILTDRDGGAMDLALLHFIDRSHTHWVCEAFDVLPGLKAGDSSTIRRWSVGSRCTGPATRALPAQQPPARRLYSRSRLVIARRPQRTEPDRQNPEANIGGRSALQISGDGP